MYCFRLPKFLLAILLFFQSAQGVATSNTRRRRATKKRKEVKGHPRRPEMASRAKHGPARGRAHPHTPAPKATPASAGLRSRLRSSLDLRKLSSHSFVLVNDRIGGRSNSRRSSHAVRLTPASTVNVSSDLSKMSFNYQTICICRRSCNGRFTE